MIFPESVYLDGDLNPPPAADVSRKFSVAFLVRVARRRDRPRGQQEEAPRAVTDVVVGDDGLARCLWGYSTPEYHDYHDHEWGLPVGDDRRIFEKLCLEGFQVGLSWLTILRKREGFRRAFANFEPAVIAAFGPTEIEQLIRDPHIVRPVALPRAVAFGDPLDLRRT